MVNNAFVVCCSETEVITNALGYNKEVNMESCKRCGSMAINPSHHGRTNSDMGDLCDVCYWRTTSETLIDIMKKDADLRSLCSARFAEEFYKSNI